MKIFKHTHNVFPLSVIFLAIGLFVFSTVSHAQDFIEPSDQAPKNNVLDFMSQSGDTQARFGKLRINSAVIPNGEDDPVVDVVGNVVLQGNTNFDRQNSTTLLSVNISQKYVTSGTNSANGKLTVQNISGSAVYAESSGGDAIFSKVTSEEGRAVFGQTKQVPSGPESSGVVGEAKNASGAGIYAQQQNCTGADISLCGVAAQFVGNVVVTGVIQGDGRGIVRTWTLNDVGDAEAKKGISIQTFDVPDDLFTTDTPRTWSTTGDSGVFAPGGQFISLSVMEGNAPYDPEDGMLAETEPDYLSVSFSLDSRTLEIKKGANHTADIVVLVYYHQQLTAEILDENGNSIAVENALVGSNTQHKFTASIGGGTFNGGEFLWSLHTDPAGTSDPCQNDNLDLPGSCGSIVEIGTSTVYVPPTDLPGVNVNTIYLKAVWAVDSSVSDVQQIDLYDISITNEPGTDWYVLIGGDTFDFEATSSCPEACPDLAWSLESPQLGTIDPVTGLYTPPQQVVSGSSWLSVVRVEFEGLPDLYRQTYFNLYPKIEIEAYIPDANDSAQGPWTDAERPSVAISQTLMLKATAIGVPGAFQNNFNWEKTGSALAGEAITSTGAPAGQSNGDYPEVTYKAAASIPSPPPYRTVSATWRKTDGTPSPVSKTLKIYVGRGHTPAPTFVTTEGATQTKYFNVYGFGDERKLYSFCLPNMEFRCLDDPPEQVIGDYSAITPSTPLTIDHALTRDCGTLQLTGVTQDPLCNPDTVLCSATMNFSYTASGTGLCTFATRLAGDSRSTVLIKLDPQPSGGGGGGCFCKTGTETCCEPGWGF